VKKTPRHIAVIMDGNGRWAKQRGNDRSAGHRAGTDATRRIVRACGERGIEHLTLYTFSSENWQRPPMEVRALMSLLVEMVNQEIDDLHTNNVKLRTIGDLAAMPDKPREAIQAGVRKTESNTGLNLHLALSYGGRQEILDGVRSMARAAQTGRVSPEEITEEMFRRSLYAPDVPDPDLMIRTGGDRRISNFLLWQAAYAELWFTDVLWPDFSAEHLDEALKDFSGRQRRFGRVSEA
jgi:undecaprenyl diphosphate synthase